MKRNWYAAIILVTLAALLIGCSKFVASSSEKMRQSVRTAYAYAQVQEYAQAKTAYHAAAAQAAQDSPVLGLLVRRNLLDRVNETMATLAEYAQEDNLSDLAVETQRVCAQISQMEKSFVGIF